MVVLEEQLKVKDLEEEEQQLLEEEAYFQKVEMVMEVEEVLQSLVVGVVKQLQVVQVKVSEEEQQSKVDQQQEEEEEEVK